MNALSSRINFGTGFASFRFKFIALIALAVLISLLVSSGVALWNVKKLSQDASEEIGSGLRKASEEYVERYIDMTAQRANLMFGRSFDQLNTLAEFQQSLIDQPQLQDTLSELLARDPGFRNEFVYDPVGKWMQNQPGAKSVVSIWGYLLKNPSEVSDQASDIVAKSQVFDLIAQPIMKSGQDKLQTYFVGPKASPVMRTMPYADQAQTFDRLYPGHNEQNWWDFFFPGIYESWQKWIKEPGSRPTDSDITVLAPYVDAITGKLIVSYFHPLFTQARDDIAGLVGIDITLEQLTELVEGVKIAETGFAFLVQQNGNILTLNPNGEALLGVSAENSTGSGVTSLSRSIRKSRFPEISSLQLPLEGTIIKHVTLKDGNEQKALLLALHPLQEMNFWEPSEGIKSEQLSLIFVVPENEIYASLRAAQLQIDATTSRIVQGLFISVLIFLVVALIVSIAISRRFTEGLVSLAEAARRLSLGDQQVQVEISGRDEIAQVGLAFNNMAKEIRDQTVVLEQRVQDRTRALAVANTEIQKLYDRLQDENLRLGTELDVARRIQMMVLPSKSELISVPSLEIAAYVEPANEVGGDYYDVLHTDGRTKIGIGDVTGHGIESGVLMLMVQSITRALHEQGISDPLAFLQVLNRAIYKNITRTKADKHLSLSFLDYADGRISISGQHEEVLFIKKGDLQRIDTIDLGFPIGLEEDISDFVTSMSVSFDPEDVIILFTDGITEAENADGQLYGIERLMGSALRSYGRSAQSIADTIIEELKSFIGSAAVLDDITLVVIKRK